MKKILGLLLVMMMLVTPFTVRAVTADDEEINIKKYNTMNFREILAQEQIKEEFKEYAETDDQITIYLFRGNGCGYCQKFLNFLNGITDEYGKYFKVVGFEVWNNADNSKLLEKISDFLEQPASGVPYIIIGDQVFGGFADSYADGIKAAITSLYDSEERYDVFEAYNDAVGEAKAEEYRKYVRPVIFNAIFVAIGVCVVCYFIKKQNEELLGKLVEQKYTPTKVVREEKVEATEKPATKVVKKTTKKKRR